LAEPLKMAEPVEAQDAIQSPSERLCCLMALDTLGRLPATAPWASCDLSCLALDVVLRRF